MDATTANTLKKANLGPLAKSILEKYAVDEVESENKVEEQFMEAESLSTLKNEQSQLLNEGKTIRPESIAIQRKIPEHPQIKTTTLPLVWWQYNKLEPKQLLQKYMENPIYQKIIDGIKNEYIATLRVDVVWVASNVPTNLNDSDFQKIYMPHQGVIDAKVEEILQNDTSYERLANEAKTSYKNNMTLAVTRGFASAQIMKKELNLTDENISFSGKIDGPIYQNDPENSKKYEEYQGVVAEIRCAKKTPQINYTVAEVAESNPVSVWESQIEISNTLLGQTYGVMPGIVSFATYKWGNGDVGSITIPIYAYDLEDIGDVLNMTLWDDNWVNNIKWYDKNIFNTLQEEYKKLKSKYDVDKSKANDIFTNKQYGKLNSPLKELYEQRKATPWNYNPNLTPRQNILKRTISYDITKYQEKKNYNTETKEKAKAQQSALKEVFTNIEQTIKAWDVRWNTIN